MAAKIIVRVLMLLGVLRASALPSGKSWRDDSIVSQDKKPWDGNSYSFGFHTLFGSSRNENAELKKDALGAEYMDVEGEYSYQSEDGSVRKVSYRANNLGYQQSEASVVRVDSKLDSQIIHPTLDTKNIYHGVNKGPIETILTKPNTPIIPSSYVNIIDQKPAIDNIIPGPVLLNNGRKPEEVITAKERIWIVRPPQETTSILKTNLNPDRIVFPTESNVVAQLATERAVLTTSFIPPAPTNGTNGTSMDYYDELGNRLGGIPPAVLGSLLG